MLPLVIKSYAILYKKRINFDEASIPHYLLFKNQEFFNITVPRHSDTAYETIASNYHWNKYVNWIDQPWPLFRKREHRRSAILNKLLMLEWPSGGSQKAGFCMRDTYMVEYVAQALRHKPNIWSLTPDKKIQSNVKKLQLLLLMFCNIMTDPTRQKWICRS